MTASRPAGDSPGHARRGKQADSTTRRHGRHRTVRFMFEERRIHPRECIALPLRLGLHGRAVTRDVSGGGLFLEVEGEHSFAGALDFELELPQARIRFRSRAQIVRIERGAGITGLALRLIASRLEPVDGGSPPAESGAPR
jgi:hypothetical protein